jgi:hypothetical protein
MRRTKFAVSAVAAIAAVGLLASCGSSSNAIVRVGQSTITKAALNHWMSVMVAGDFRAELGKSPPAGLVSDPPNYRACTAAARSLAAHAQTPRVLVALCHQLYQAVKVQALTFLIDASWHIEDAREHGEAAGIKEMEQRLRRLKANELPKPGQFQDYLGQVDRTKADELYLFRRNILAERLLARLQREAGKGSSSRAALGRLIEEWLARWTAKTNCESGYVAPQCRQYKGGQASSLSPNQLLQQLVGHS